MSLPLSLTVGRHDDAAESESEKRAALRRSKPSAADPSAGRRCAAIRSRVLRFSATFGGRGLVSFGWKRRRRARCRTSSHRRWTFVPCYSYTHVREGSYINSCGGRSARAQEQFESLPRAGRVRS